MIEVDYAGADLEEVCQPHRADRRRGRRRPHRPALDGRLLRVRARIRLPARRGRTTPGPAPLDAADQGARRSGRARRPLVRDLPAIRSRWLAADRSHRRTVVGPRPRPAGTAAAGHADPLRIGGVDHDRHRAARPAGDRAGSRPARPGPSRRLPFRRRRPRRAPPGQPAGRQPRGRRDHRDAPRRAGDHDGDAGLGGGHRCADRVVGQRPRRRRRTARSRCGPGTGWPSSRRRWACATTSPSAAGSRSPGLSAAGRPTCCPVSGRSRSAPASGSSSADPAGRCPTSISRRPTRRVGSST